MVNIWTPTQHVQVFQPDVYDMLHFILVSGRCRFCHQFRQSPLIHDRKTADLALNTN